MRDNAWTLAARLLDKTLSRGGYSNIVLNAALDNTALPPAEKKLCTALYYGVIERLLTIDHALSGYLKKPLKKLDTPVLQTLRCGMYALLFMDKTPDSAAVNSAVGAVSALGFTSAKGMVNAVLRSFLRDGKKTVLPQDETAALSIKYSVPLWLVKKWKSEYPDELTSLLESTVSAPPLTIRWNPLHPDAEAFFADNGINAQPLALDGAYNIMDAGAIRSVAGYDEGCFHVQDFSSQLCCAALDPQPDETVFDMCSAPGGKAFTIAGMMKNSGRVLAFDLYEKRTGLIKSGAERLGFTCIEARTGDSTVYDPANGQADRVLCDAVCGGLGVIRRKPEIKYKSPDSFDELPQMQYSLLLCASRYVREGGVLVYSTCTLSRAENDSVAKRFLDENPDFCGESFLEELGAPFGGYCATVFPARFGGDGFFIAKFRKKSGGKDV